MIATTRHTGRTCAALGMISIAVAVPAHAHRLQKLKLSPSGGGTAYDSARGRIVVVEGGNYQIPSATWEYDGGPAWIPGPPLPAANGVTGHALAFHEPSGATVLYGGSAGTSTWLYDGASWTQGPTAPAAMGSRNRHAMAYDRSRGRVVLFGGSSSPGTTTWELDGTSWIQGPAAPPPLGVRYGPAMAFDAARGAMIIFGGSPTGSQLVKSDAWLYDGASYTAGPVTPTAIAPRWLHGMAYDAVRSVVVLFGGADQDDDPLGDTWELGAAGWSPGGPAPSGLEPRWGMSIAYDAVRARVVIHGGIAGQTPYADTWEYDGGWRHGSTFAPRSDHAAAYDAARQLVVTFGGADGTDLMGDTWEFDGARWRPGAAPPPGLTPRAGHALAYDASRTRVVLIGGWDGALRNDVWELDGSGWSAGPAAPLAPRWRHAATYHPGRGVVVFGGWDGALRADTWFHDGSQWVSGPPPGLGMTGRVDHAMAHDAARGRTVLYGGWSGASLSDTWELDGTRWISRALPNVVGAQSRHTMAYDPGLGAIYLAGPYSTIIGIWHYDGVSWSLGITATGIPTSDAAMAFHEASGRAVVIGGISSGGTSTTVVDDTMVYYATDSYLAGAGFAQINGNRVRVLDLGVAHADFAAYAAGAWGVDVAAGSVDADPRAEILTGPGPGDVFGPHVRGFETDGVPMAKISFYAYGTLKYGANVRGGSVDGDAPVEILTGPGPGAVFGPQVRGFDPGATVMPIPALSYYAYGTLRYGVTVGSGDVDADGFAEILTGPGPGPTFGAQVRGWDHDGVRPAAAPGLDFVPFPGLWYGVLAAGGDVDGDGAADIAATPGPGPDATYVTRFLGFQYSSAAVTALPGFDLSLQTHYVGRVALGDVSESANADLVGAAGPDPAARSYASAYVYVPPSLLLIESFDAMAGARHGVNVATGDFGH